jgi:hypothetical protein
MEAYAQKEKPTEVIEQSASSLEIAAKFASDAHVDHYHLAEYYCNLAQTWAAIAQAEAQTRIAAALERIAGDEGRLKVDAQVDGVVLNHY